MCRRKMLEIVAAWQSEGGDNPYELAEQIAQAQRECSAEVVESKAGQLTDEELRQAILADDLVCCDEKET